MSDKPKVDNSEIIFECKDDITDTNVLRTNNSPTSILQPASTRGNRFAVP